jgi:hypothetical protein
MNNLPIKISPADVLDDSTMVLSVFSRKWKRCNKAIKVLIGKLYIAPESYDITQIRVITWGKKQSFEGTFSQIKSAINENEEPYVITPQTKITYINDIGGVKTYKTITKRKASKT